MIGEGVTINGNIKSDNEVIIKGSVEGDIECNSITIDSSGNLKGKIKAENMTVKGKVEGEININNLLEIKSKGNASGKIFYGGIQIDEEGKLAGEINFKDSNNKQEEFNSSSLDTYRITKELVENKLIEYDKETNTIIFNADVNFKFKGNLNIDGDKHIFLNSGKKLDTSLGYTYSVWLNPQYDEEGKATVDSRVIDVEV